uniref:Uncharacterized protein n=1 Tax=Heterorhabditis bacteriophora TaxID=37862 RepID=A0A1I7WUV5_HETBA
MEYFNKFPILILILYANSFAMKKNYFILFLSLDFVFNMHMNETLLCEPDSLVCLNILTYIHGAWKLGGFDFSMQGTSGINGKVCYYLSYIVKWTNFKRIPSICQPSLDYLAPEYILKSFPVQFVKNIPPVFCDDFKMLCFKCLLMTTCIKTIKKFFYDVRPLLQKVVPYLSGEFGTPDLIPFILPSITISKFSEYMIVLIAKLTFKYCKIILYIQKFYGIQTFNN